MLPVMATRIDNHVFQIWHAVSFFTGVTTIYCKHRERLTADQFYEQVLQFMDYLNLMSRDDNGSQKFKCDFDGYHKAEHIHNWNNAIINWVEKANYILLILTPELHYCLTQSHEHPIEMMGGSVSSSAITNLFSGSASRSRSFIPVFLNVPVNRQLIPPSLNSNAFYEVHMENLNPEHNPEQQKAYLDNHQEEMSGLINLLRHLRQEM